MMQRFECDEWQLSLKSNGDATPAANFDLLSFPPDVRVCFGLTAVNGRFAQSVLCKVARTVNYSLWRSIFCCDAALPKF